MKHLHNCHRTTTHPTHTGTNRRRRQISFMFPIYRSNYLVIYKQCYLIIAYHNKFIAKYFACYTERRLHRFRATSRRCRGDEGDMFVFICSRSGADSFPIRPNLRSTPLWLHPIVVGSSLHQPASRR